MKGEHYEVASLLNKEIEDGKEMDLETCMVMVSIMEEFNHRGVKKVLEQGLMQYMLQKAIKKFGKKGFNAGMEEFEHLHKRSMFSPLSAEELSSKDKKKALESLMFIKEKRDKWLKGRTCAHGKKQ